jgi:hypothetical protein
MKSPRPDDLRLAAEWLRQYDDEHDGGQDSLRARRVADWLDEQASAKELREAAAEARIPVDLLRRALQRQAPVPGGPVIASNLEPRHEGT